MTVKEFMSQFDKEFFRNWFVEGPRLILNGKFSRRSGGFIIAASMPVLLSTMFLVLPGILFPTPQHNAFFQFAKVIDGDLVSLLPLALGTISAIFSFRLPLGS